MFAQFENLAVFGKVSRTRKLEKLFSWFHGPLSLLWFAQTPPKTFLNFEFSPVSIAFDFRS